MLFGYRISPSEVTGESPFFLLYGRQPRLPKDVSMLPPRDISASIADHCARVVENIEVAQRIDKENIQCAQQRMKDYHAMISTPFLSGFKWVIMFGFIRLPNARVCQRSSHITSMAINALFNFCRLYIALYASWTTAGFLPLFTYLA